MLLQSGDVCSHKFDENNQLENSCEIFSALKIHSLCYVDANQCPRCMLHELLCLLDSEPLRVVSQNKVIPVIRGASQN